MKTHYYLFLSLFILGLFSSPDLKAQLEFIENQGQWPGTFGLRAKLNHGDFWLSGNKVSMVLSDFGQNKDPKNSHPHGNEFASKEHSYEMEFLGASPTTKVVGGLPKTQYHNYFISNDSKTWKSKVPLYGMAIHKDIYPGTDLIWEEEKGNLKYEFQLQAGARPDRIEVRYKGQNTLRLKGNKLEINTSIGKVTEGHPYSYQLIGGKKVSVQCRFALRSPNTIGFDFPRGYNPKFPLVIDPVLIFSSFSGSRSDNWGFSATYGENGTAYAAGICLGTKFPISTGAFQQNYGGDSTGTNIYSTFDIGILKFNPDGTQLLFSTYLGGSEAETPSSLVTDKNGNLIVFGASGSANFPTTVGAFDRTFNGGVSVSPYGPDESIVRFRQGSDMIISKFSPDGTQLVGSTFLGGSQNDGVLELISFGNSPLVRNYGDAFRSEVAVDSLGNIYIASHTKSTNFPQVQSLQTIKSGGFDAVCAKINSNCTSLLFSTYLGGNLDDGAFSLQVEKSGSVVLTGGTASSNFTVSSGTIHPTFQGVVDGFVCRFIPGLGNSSYRGTFLGTSAYDQAYFVQLDQKRNVYLYGQSKGNYPIVGNPYSNAGGKQFIHCISPTLDTTRFSTVFGSNSGNTNIAPTAFLVDDCGRIYISGWGGFLNNISGLQNGNTTGMPTTADAFSQTTDGSDFYVMVLERNADSLAFATFFGDTQAGTEHVDGGTSRFDRKGVVYQAVCAGCGGQSSFPSTPGVVSNTNQSTNCNNAIFKYDFSLLKSKYQPSAIQGCAPLTVKFTSQSSFATSYIWEFGDGQIINTVTDTVTHVFDSSGTFAVKLAALNPDGCPSVDYSTQNITVQKIPAFTNDSLFFCNDEDTLVLNGLPLGPYSYSWSPASYLSSSNTIETKVRNPDSTLVYTATVTSSFGCKRLASYLVSDKRLEVSGFADTMIGCRPLAVHFSNQNKNAKSFTWFWGSGDSTDTGQDTISHVFQSAGVFQVLVRAFNDTTCQPFAFDTLTIRVEDAPAFNDSTISICRFGETIQIGWLPQNVSYQYQWTPSNFLSSTTTASPQIIQPDSTLTYQATLTTNLGCKRTRNLLLSNRIHQAIARADTLKGCIPFIPNFYNQSYRGGNYSWIWSDSDSTLTGDPQLTHAFPLAGIFPVVLHSRNDTACQVHSFDTLYIKALSLPVFADTLLRFCTNGSVSLQMPRNNGIGFHWEPAVLLNNPDTLQPIMDSATSQVFQVSVRDSNQCRYTGKVMLRDGILKADFTLSTVGRCVPIDLVVVNEGINPQQTIWYWNEDSIQVADAGNFALQETQPGIYTLGMKVKSDTACLSEDYMQQEIHLGGIGPLATQEVRVCRGDSALVQIPYEVGWRYSWPITARPFGDSSKALVTSLLTAPNPFSVVIQDSLGCYGEQMVILNPFRPPSFITPVSLFDPCSDALLYEFQGPAISQNTYSWLVNNIDLSGDTVQYRFPARGTYPLRLVAREGTCEDTLATTITVADPPLILNANFFIDQKITGCQSNPEIQTVNLSQGATLYNWEWEGGSSSELNPVLAFPHKGVFNVILIVSNGVCERVMSKEVEVYPFLLPSLVTPDANGLNDALVIENLPPQTLLEVQNRWGQKLYQTANYQNDWVPPTDFDVGFYYIRLPNGISCSSWLKSSR